MDTRERLLQIADGVYVEEDTLRIAEKIQEYDPNLKLKFAAGLAEPGDAPYKLVEVCRDGVERVVFDIWELDDRVLDRIRMADTVHNDILSRLDAQNLQAKLNEKRRYEEKMLVAADIAKSVIYSHKDTYTARDPETGRLLKFTSTPR